MDIKVIKRDGSHEGFDPEKIRRVALATGLTQEQTSQLVDEVTRKVEETGKAEITSREIRKYVTEELRKISEYAYGLYVWYEKSKDHDGRQV
jgi:transcriptional regulator NrdR family protein